MSNGIAVNHRGILYLDMKVYMALFFIVLCGLLGTTLPIQAQQVKGALGDAAPGPQGTLEIETRAGIVTDLATQAEQMIQGLATVEELTPQIRNAARRHGELLLLITSMTAADFVRLERLSRLQDLVIIEEGRLEGIHARLTARLVKLGVVHAAWTDRRHQWHDHR